MENTETVLHVGLDVGSTTVKIAVLDENLNTLYTDYERHFSDTKNTLCNVLKKLIEKYPDNSFTISLTGSGAMSAAKFLDLEKLNYLNFYDNTARTQTIRITDIKMVDTDPETIIESEYVSNDNNEMIFSNTSSLVISPQTTVVSGEIALYKSARF